MAEDRLLFKHWPKRPQLERVATDAARHAQRVSAGRVDDIRKHGRADQQGPIGTEQLEPGCRPQDVRPEEDVSCFEIEAVVVDLIGRESDRNRIGTFATRSIPRAGIKRIGEKIKSGVAADYNEVSAGC